jgi:hypothetical protein
MQNNMPTPEQILDSLRQIANQWQPIAIVWHLYFGAFAIGLALGWHPSIRISSFLLGLPMLSVSAFAWMASNPFNGTMFALAGVALLIIAIRMPDEPVQIAPAWAMLAGALMFLFGWLYPHFLETTSFIPYLYAAPTGLIPCPTLSILIGLTLILAGLDSRAWSLLLGAVGIFYGLFGALRLGVIIDLFLLLGALLLVMLVIAGKPQLQRRALAH